MDIFSQHFMRIVFIGGAIAAATCAYIGVFVILKRIVFLGIALSEIAALGLAAGLFMNVDPVLSAFIFTIAGVVLFWMPFTEKRLSRESILGFSYALCASLSIILIAKNPLAESRGLNLISGNLLYTTNSDLLMLLGAALFILVLHVIYFKQFLFISFDRETASTTGINTGLIDFLLYLGIGITISVSMKTCGVIFVFASLVIPPMIGLIVSKKIGKIFVVSCVAAVVCVLLGLLVSYIFDLPSSPTIVGVYGLLFIVSFGFRRLYS